MKHFFDQMTNSPVVVVGEVATDALTGERFFITPDREVFFVPISQTSFHKLTTKIPQFFAAEDFGFPILQEINDELKMYGL